jgi:hypothetical protein
MVNAFVRASAAVVVGVVASAQTPPPKRSLLDTLLRIAGLTAAPSQMRGSEAEVGSGNIWVVGVDGRGARALTADGGYRSPLFSINDDSLVALKGDAVVRISIGDSRAVQQQRAAGVTRLVGFDRADGDSLIVLLDAAAAPLASVSMRTGRITPLPYDASSPDDRRMLAQVRADARVYGETSVYTKTETKRGLARNVDWLDVYVKRGAAAATNVSACDGTNCVQPALSADGRRIAFVKAEN